ncbi:MAG: Zn-dependent protease [Alphaproteobacteria bacterium]|nr:MAG: Zn-dependent protease [Alphaproteobacteria bacterium]
MPHDGQSFAGLPAPGLDTIEALARAALAALPPPFRDWLDDVVLRVTDFPDDDIVAEMALESPFDILGLYHGTAVGDKSSSDVAPTPDMIFLYRRPILDYWAASDESLGDLVAHVLVHEVGHHFGLSDADMAAIEAQVVDSLERG